jgi:predicted RNA polymerase sigma factor
MAAAKFRAIDAMRRGERFDRKREQLAALHDDARPPDFEAALDEPVGDDLLRLIFTACHPALSQEARVALTLRLLGGLTTEAIAHAFLVPESTIAQRIVRAKRTLAEVGASFETPRGPELHARLPSVLAVVYLIFNEGYAPSSGPAWVRESLCEDALRLARMLAQLCPDEREVHGLTALLELQASRLRARVGATGEPIRLLEQDRRRWDRVLIGRGLEALERGHRLGGAPGPYWVQAAIAACHACAPTAADTPWSTIVGLYEQLEPTPIVELNRAVAVAMAEGPARGLEIVEGLREVLADHHLLASVRGDLLERLGRLDEARDEFARAATQTRNASEQVLLHARAMACEARSCTGDRGQPTR